MFGITATVPIGASPLGAIAQAASASDFTVFSYDLDSNGLINLPGQLYVPAGYDPTKSYKLVTFFHGGSERGTDNLAQINGNINNLLKYAKQEKFFIYAPQTTGGWSEGTLDTVSNMIAKATTTYNIDRSRLYVTGLSMGGRGTWDMASNFAGVFAGAVPISANRSDSVDFATLADTPIWAFHARDDDEATASTTTRRMVNAIRNADGGKPALTFPLNNSPSNPYYNTGTPYYSDGSTFYAENKLRYTEYASGGHGVWTRAYNEPGMYQWLLAQSGGVAPPRAEAPVLITLGASVPAALDSAGRNWNTAPAKTDHTYGPSISFAADSQGARTSVILDVQDTFTAANTESWYTGATTAAAAQAAKGIIVLHGLEAGEHYRISLFATHADDDLGRGRVTRYTIGEQWRDLDIVGNADRLAIFADVLADAAGKLTLTVQAAPDGQSRYGFLGGIEIAVVPEPVGMALLLPAAVGLLARRRRHR